MVSKVHVLFSIHCSGNNIYVYCTHTHRFGNGDAGESHFSAHAQHLRHRQGGSAGIPFFTFYFCCASAVRTLSKNEKMFIFSTT